MTENQQTSQCPACREPIQPGWRLCPVCETRLQPLVCPVCAQPVKENWKRCPQCEAPLMCTGCGRRLPPGARACPACGGPSEPSAPPALPEAFTDHVCGIEMIYVPPGRFRMGDTYGLGTESEQPVHEVMLDGFYIGRYAITQTQWLRLMDENPSKFDGPLNPVEQVTWDDARLFARLLTEAHQGGYRFDLPSEAQWEYAARSGGREEVYAGGDNIDALSWYEGNSQGHPHPVGVKSPNGLGIYDMSGNVWEWCLDAYSDTAYKQHTGRNPLLPGDSQSDRVIRGGSWHLDDWSARCARRFSFTQDFMGPGLGFRLVMTPQA